MKRPEDLRQHSRQTLGDHQAITGSEQMCCFLRHLSKSQFTEHHMPKSHTHSLDKVQTRVRASPRQAPQPVSAPQQVGLSLYTHLKSTGGEQQKGTKAPKRSHTRFLKELLWNSKTTFHPVL